MKLIQTNYWSIDEVKENIDRLRKAGGSINEEIITYCDYGSKCKTGLVSFLSREFLDINLKLDESNVKEIEEIEEFFKERGINYYTIKEFILKIFDENFPIEKVE
jgi:hypothetical protein